MPKGCNLPKGDGPKSQNLAMEEVVDDASHTSYIGVDADKHEGMSYGVGLWCSRKVARWCHC